jgi:hypothetical protein
MQMAEQPGSELESSSRVDTELVRAAQEGSASAARLIVRRHNQWLIALRGRLSGTIPKPKAGEGEIGRRG